MSVLIESLVLVLLRLGLFFSCRKYLLNSLYSDLRKLSSSTTTTTSPSIPGTPLDELEEVELTLPTHTNTNRVIKRHQSSHSTIARSVFAACFSESCMLFVLLMCQGLGIFSASARLLNFRFSLLALLATILLLTPLFTSLLLTSGSKRKLLSPIRIFTALVPITIYLFAFSRIPLPTALADTDLLTATIARLIVLGTIILGLLSGFGAVSSSWRYLPSPFASPSRVDTVPTEKDVELAERALERVKEDLDRLKKRMAGERERERERSSGSSAASVSDSGSGSVLGSGRKTSWFPTLNLRSAGGEDAAELKGLELLHEQMTSNMMELRVRRQEARWRGTLLGRVWGVVERVMAVYWIGRLGWSIINFFVPKTPGTSSTNYPDLISKLLGDLVAMVYQQRHPETPAPPSAPSMETDLSRIQEDIKVVARQISLILVGIIILTSVRLVMRGVSRVLSRVTTSGTGTSTDSKSRFGLGLEFGKSVSASVMLMLLAQLMGIYLLSTIVQLRTSFPPPEPQDLDLDPPSSSSTSSCIPASGAYPCGAESNLFSAVPEFQVFGSLFDAALLVAAGVSAGVRWIGSRVGVIGEY